MSENVTEVQVINDGKDAALYLLTKAEIDTQISTAKAFPRSIAVFMKKAESMATLTEDIAASCVYALPRAGKSIEGPSIRLAEIVVAAYGNIRAGARIISNDGKTITAQGTCHDLENNVAAQVEVKRRITGKNGQTFNEDMQVIVGNAACAIAYRNAVYKVIPAALINPMYEQAKLVARGTAATLVTRRNAALEYFKSLKVTDEQICKVLDIKKVEDIDLDKLAILTGMKSAIKNGESTVRDLFEPEAAATVSHEDLKELYDLKFDALSEDEQTNAVRILTNKETNSYNKLHELLKSK
jgi:hypothetical protein